MTSNPPLLDAAPPRASRLQIAALAFIMAWPLLIIDRGFDLTDSGYYLFNYRYAFSWPEVNSLSMLLTNWAGGLITALLPETGLFLAFKIICVALYALITWFSWLVLREHFPAWLNIGALALANIYPVAFIYIFSYNTLSYLFLSAAVLLLYRGLARDKPLLLYLAGIILGLNVFTRLPNILEWGLAAAVFWHYWFCLQARRRAISLTLRFTLSVLAGWLAFFSLARLVLGPEIISRELEGLANALFGVHKETHSAFAMWDSYDLYVREGLGMLALMAPLAPLTLALGAGIYIFRQRKWAPSLLATLGLAAGAAFALLGGEIYEPYLFNAPVWDTPLASLCVFLAPAGPLIALIGALWHHQRRPLLSSLAVMAIAIFMAMPFGSDYHVSHYLYYTHLTLPLVLGLAWRLWPDLTDWLGEARPRFPQPLGAARPALACANAFFWCLLAGGLKALSDDGLSRAHGDVYYGAASFPVEGSSFLSGMKTAAYQAWWLRDMAEKTYPYRDLPFVALGHCALCLFLTEAEPLLPAPWLDLFSLPQDYLERGLEEAVRKGRPPLILMVEHMGIFRLGWRNHYNDERLRRFMVKNRYTLEVDHGFFKLYLPPGRGQGPPVSFTRPGDPQIYITLTGPGPGNNALFSPVRPGQKPPVSFSPAKPQTGAGQGGAPADDARKKKNLEKR